MNDLCDTIRIESVYFVKQTSKRKTARLDFRILYEFAFFVCQPACVVSRPDENLWIECIQYVVVCIYVYI